VNGEREQNAEPAEAVGEEPGAATESAAEDAGEAADDAPQPARRGRRRRLQIAKASELGTWRYMEQHDAEEGVEVVLTGDGITNDRAEASKVGAAIHHVAKLWKELGGASPFISSFAFEGSVHITLEPSRTEVRRVREERDRARKLRAEDAPAKEIEAALRSSVPDVDVAAALAADLLSAPIDETPLRAAEFGTNAAQAVRSLALSLARDKISVTIVSRDRDERVRLTPARAEQVADVLREVQEPRRFNVTAIGALSMADAIHRQFALVLDPGDKPDVFKGKRVVRGRYAPAIGDRIRDQGFWGKRVAATIQVERDALISTSKVRPPVFTLVGVEPPSD
jgi:hypothetical protein